MRLVSSESWVSILRFFVFLVFCSWSVVQADPGSQQRVTSPFLNSRASYYLNAAGSGDFATIQDAVDAVPGGSEIILGDGVFSGEGNRDIDFHGKNLAIRSESGNPDSCVIDCGGSAAEPHFGFWFHSGEDLTSVLQGIKVTGAHTAGPGFAVIMVGAGPLFDNPEYIDSEVSLVDCYIVENVGTGLSAKSLSSNSFGGIADLSGCSLSNNDGKGFISGHNFSMISDCSFDNNSDVGAELTWMGHYGGPPIINSSFSNNGGNGVYSWNMYLSHASFVSCTFEGNEGYGLEIREYLQMVDCHVADNQAGGLHFHHYNGLWLAIDDSEFVNNGGNGIDVVGGSLLNIELSNVTVSSNSGVGLFVDVHGGNEIYLDHLLLSNNTGNGFELVTSPNGEGSVFDTFCTFSTIVGNSGGGIVYSLCENSHLDLEGVIVTDNHGESFTQSGGFNSQINLNCTDIFNNADGDWIGEISNQQHQNENLTADPQFCDPDNQNYYVAASSPCAEFVNYACGQVGAFGAMCEADFLSCYELQSYDQETGAITTPLMNVSVSVQGVVFVKPGTYSQYGGGYLMDNTGGINFWRLPLPDAIEEGDIINIAGPLWPDGNGELYVGNYAWNIVSSGSTALPVSFSITELLSDYHNIGNFVSVSGEASDITQDSFWLSDGNSQIEVFRTDYTDVSFSDVSEGSNWRVSSPCFMSSGTMRLSPRRQEDLVMWDTVPAETSDLPVNFRLLPCYPNPFNPATTISYELPLASKTSLAIFDMKGRLVKYLLVGKEEIAGRHDVLWNGADSRGRPVAAGVYLYRLQAGDYQGIRRMVLVK